MLYTAGAPILIIFIIIIGCLLEAFIYDIYIAIAYEVNLNESSIIGKEILLLIYN